MDFSPRQIEIIKKATELINQGGIQQLTTKALAEKMKFSEPALYRHFTSKTDILSSILNFYTFELKTKMDDLLKEKGAGLEKLRQVVDFQFDHFAKHPAIVMVIFAETSFQFEESLSKSVLSIMTTKKQRVEMVISQGQSDGSIRKDCKVSPLATIFLGSMRFTILQWRLNGYKTDLRKEGKMLWSSLEKILTPG